MKPIFGFEGTYAMSSEGVVFRLTGNTGKLLKSPKPVKQHIRKDGYCLTHLSKNNKVTTFLSHRLVWETMNGKVAPGAELNHINGIRSDNRPENLEICTRSENMIHKFKVLGYRQHTVGKRGEDHSNSLLSADSVKQIRERWKQGEPQSSLAAVFGVHQTTISDIVRRKAWRHLD
ncbi:HNH endonuclease [Sinorhizobium medicae]|uniref:HNH endonuclease n=1 Tax=Sinorhizobium medicae TaxID=110321 RepID=UPI002AF6AFFA|nr:HNH endonuclease [Sinorhizobium medicae]WQO60311.1 HNH endonuclease [Sinorhizobium medicae]